MDRVHRVVEPSGNIRSPASHRHAVALHQRALRPKGRPEDPNALGALNGTKNLGPQRSRNFLLSLESEAGFGHFRYFPIALSPLNLSERTIYIKNGIQNVGQYLLNRDSF